MHSNLIKFSLYIFVPLFIYSFIGKFEFHLEAKSTLTIWRKHLHPKPGVDPCNSKKHAK